MGSRDKRQKEVKKQKKDTKKIQTTGILSAPPPEVEVIKKGKKQADW